MEGEKYIIKIYLFMMLICCVCCEKQADMRIVMGKPAKISDFPYLVGIRDNKIDAVDFGSGHICGGALISSVKIVTAAHCFFRFQPASSFSIILGIERMYEIKDAFISGVKTFKIHEEFEGANNVNIAIAILETEVPADHPIIKPIKLPTSTPKPGTLCRIAGWGSDRFGGVRSNQLLATDVAIISHDECQKRYDLIPVLTGMMCAGTVGSNAGPCDGDFGNPLTYNNELVGIASWGLRCGETSMPMVYTNVYMYKDWINDIAERSRGVSSFRSNEITVFYTLLMSLSWCFIKK